MGQARTVFTFTQLVDPSISHFAILKEEGFDVFTVFGVRQRIQSFIADGFPTHVQVEGLETLRVFACEE